MLYNGISTENLVIIIYYYYTVSVLFNFYTTYIFNNYIDFRVRKCFKIPVSGASQQWDCQKIENTHYIIHLRIHNTDRTSKIFLY